MDPRSPPQLSYINSKARQPSAPSRRAAAGGAGGRSRPMSAATTMSRPRSAAMSEFSDTEEQSPKRRSRHFQSRTFLRDNEVQEAVLPQPLPGGIQYVAEYTSYEDLIQRRILHQNEEQQVHLSQEDVRMMYEAKCKDQNLRTTWEREVRFMELLSSNCKGSSFSLRENGLGRACADAMCNVLSRNQRYCIVDLGGNRLRDEGALAMGRLLQASTTIVHLSLKSNDIGPDGGEVIAFALERNNTLTSLDLGGISGINRNHIGVRGALAMGNMLKVNQTLCMLNVSSNGLGADGMSVFTPGIEGNIALTKLNLASNNLGAEGCKLLASALATAQIKNLNLERNAMGDKGATHVAQAFKMTTTAGDHIDELHLGFNGIREVGCARVAETLRTSLTLQVLALDGNSIGDGIGALSDALKENKSLTELGLAQCDLLERHGASIGAAFGINQVVTKLDLSRNRIGDAGAKALAESLKRNKSIKFLDIGANAIGDDGGGALALALRSNVTLQELVIRQNLMAACGGAINLELRKNTTLLKLDFTFNDFGFKDYSSINASLKRNNDLWRQQKAPRLAAEIETLDYAQKELYHVLEEMDLEKRATKERFDDGFRRKEAIKGHLDTHRRIVAELEEQLAVVKAHKAEKESEKDAEAEKDIKARTKMDQKQNHVQMRIQNENERRDRVLKEIEKVKKQMRLAAEQQEESTQPLVAAVQRAQMERDQDMSDARWQGEHLATMELKIKALEKGLGIASEKQQAPPAAKGKPVKPGSAKARK